MGKTMGCSQGCKAPHALVPAAKLAVTAGTIDLEACGLQEFPDLSTVPRKDFATELNASHNKLEEVSERDLMLPNLTTLQLSYNVLRSVPSLQHLAFLETVDLRHNNLSALPTHIAKVPSLTCLDVSGNRLTELPAAIGRCSTLRRLNVSDNELTALPVELCQLKLDRGGFDWSLNSLVFPPVEVREEGQQGIMDWLRAQMALDHPEVRHQKQVALKGQHSDTERWGNEMRQCAWNTQEEYEEMLLRKPHWMDCAAAIRFIESHRTGGGWWPEGDYQPSASARASLAMPVVAATEIASAPWSYDQKSNPSAPALLAPIHSLAPVAAVPVAAVPVARAVVAVGQV